MSIVNLSSLDEGLKLEEIPNRIVVQSEQPSNPTPGMLWLDTDHSVPDTIGYKNLNEVTEDYLLKAGEIGWLDFINATSVPLRVKTVEGLYEMHIQYQKTAQANGGTLLKPNNTTYPGEVFRRYLSFSGTTMSTNAGMVDAMDISWNTAISAHVLVSTRTNSKYLSCKTTYQESNLTWTDVMFSCVWDTATVWSSLGTLGLVNIQSGKIIIKRII